MKATTLLYSIVAGLIGFGITVMIGKWILTPAQPDKIFATGTVATFQFAEEPKPVTSTRFVDGAHEARKFSDFKGKTILVNLWATWCAPCITELPDLDKLQQEMGSDKFEVVAISVDESAVKAKTKLKDLGVKSLTFYHDPKQDLPKTLEAEHLPVNIVISPYTKELGRLVGPARWHEEDAQRLIKDLMKRGRQQPTSPEE